MISKSICYNLPMVKGTDINTARRAKAKALSLFGNLAQLNGIGIGRVDDGYCVKINLNDDPPNAVRLPDKLDGVPIKVEVVGRIAKREPRASKS